MPVSLLPIRDDASGNQTTLSIGGITYTQEFDYENRLVEIREGATTLAAFVYDADGNRGGAFSPITTRRFTGQYRRRRCPAQRLPIVGAQTGTCGRRRPSAVL